MTRFAFFIIFCFCCLTNLATNILDLSTGKFCNNLSTKPLCSKVDYGDSIIITYDFHAAQIINDDIFQGCIQWKYEDWGINHTQGEASFPIKYDTYQTNQDQDITISIIDSEYIDFNYELAPSRPLMIDNVNSYSSENISPIQAYSGFSSNEIIEIEDVQTQRNTSFHRIRISPIQYDHTNKIVRAFTKIKYKVDFSSTSKSRIGGIIINPNPIEQDTISRDYIIISTNKYASAVYRFAKWKQNLGFKVKTALDESWTSEKIKNKIQSLYNYSNECYALIIGDHQDVPSNISTFKPDNQVKESFHLTDLYYTCFGGTNDYYPEFPIGRLPVSTLEEANMVIDKIINYEQTPPTTPSFYNSAVFCAYFQDWNSNSYEDWLYTQTTESIRNRLIQEGKTIERIYFTEDTIIPKYFKSGESIPSELLRPIYSWDGDEYDIIRSINSGKSFALYRGHGSVNKWNSPKFSTADINLLSNWKLLPIVFSLTCSTGAFDDDCFAEAFLKKTGGGCVGIIAASASSYSPENDYLATNIFSYIWPTSTNSDIRFLGTTLNNSLLHMALQSENPSIFQKYQHEIYHCFGDPSMMIRTETPTTIPNIFVTRNAESGKAVNVSISGSEDEYIAFNDTRLGKTLLIKGRSAIYRTNFPEYVTVCVYNHNKIPYVNLGLEPEIVQTISTTDSADCISNFGPNPTNGQISFEYSISENTSSAVIIISDLYGNLKSSTTCLAENNSITIDLSNLNNGVYIATLIVDGVTKDTKRVIVQK